MTQYEDYICEINEHDYIKNMKNHKNKFTLNKIYINNSFAAASALK